MDNLLQQRFQEVIVRMLIFMLDVLDWFDRFIITSLRAIGRTVVDGFAAYGLSLYGFDPHLHHYEPPSEAEFSLRNGCLAFPITRAWMS